MIKANTLVLSGIIVIFIGIILIFVGTALQASSKNSEVHTGGVILIGPIPIIFGNDKSLIVIGIVFAIIIMVLWYLLFYRSA